MRSRMLSSVSGSGRDGRVSAAVVQQHFGSKPKSIDLIPPKGTRDFYPDDMQFRSWLFGKWRRVATAFGYETYDAPVLEHESLYVAKSGDEIKAQLFNFTDKGGRRVALRPEMTPSLARMVLARRGALLPSLPLRWSSIPQCWRYEKTTRGRRREHFQWNMDLWGVSGVEAEAELLAALVASFKSMGLSATDVGIKVSSRKLLACVFECVGLPVHGFVRACVLVDKRDKMPADELRAQLLLVLAEYEREPAGSELEACVDELLACLEVRSLAALRSRLETLLIGHIGLDAHQDERSRHQILEEGFRDCELLWELLGPQGYNIDGPGEVGTGCSWLEFDPSIVRGLAYYTGVVFEAFDRGHTLRAICGGGRYDALCSALLGEDSSKNKNKDKGTVIPAVGFGFGDAVIHELLEAKGLMPQLPPARARASHTLVWSPSGDFACARTGPQLRLLRSRVIQIVGLLRRTEVREDTPVTPEGGSGNGVECAFGSSLTAAEGARAMAEQGQSKQMKAILKRADRNGSRVVVLCTVRDLVDSNSFVVRDMYTKRQHLCSYNALVDKEGSAGFAEHFASLLL